MSFAKASHADLQLTTVNRRSQSEGLPIEHQATATIELSNPVSSRHIPVAGVPT